MTKAEREAAVKRAKGLAVEARVAAKGQHLVPMGPGALDRLAEDVLALAAECERLERTEAAARPLLEKLDELDQEYYETVTDMGSYYEPGPLKPLTEALRAAMEPKS